MLNANNDFAGLYGFDEVAVIVCEAAGLNVGIFDVDTETMQFSEVRGRGGMQRLAIIPMAAGAGLAEGLLTDGDGVGNMAVWILGLPCSRR